jgi:cytoskeletal protein CcmA (bactofilin family)
VDTNIYYDNIDGGEGTDYLVVYGTVDFTHLTVGNVEIFEVHSVVDITAQQFNTFGFHTMAGDGESMLNLHNADADPITVDFSSIELSDFRTLNIDSNVTVILDQEDIASLEYIGGEGSIQASVATGSLDLSGKHLSVTVLDDSGAIEIGHSGTSVAGELHVGTESADMFAASADADYLAFISAHHADGDVITGFDASFDKIDLSGILADQAFNYVAAGSAESATLEIGELQAQDATLTIDGEAVDGVYLQGWVDHDGGIPDFQIFLENVDQATLDATHDDWLIA